MRKKLRQGNMSQGMKQKKQDARMKIILNRRRKIVDAREKLGQIARQTDARVRLEKLRRQKLQIKQSAAVATPNLTRTVSNVHQLQHQRGQPIPSLGSSLVRTVPTQRYEPAPLMRSIVPNPVMVADPPRLTITTLNTQRRPVATSLPPGNRLHSDMVVSSRPLSSRLKSRLDANQSPIQTQTSTVLVSNLDPHSVTQEDIQELFGDIGGLHSAVLRGAGMAEVRYYRHEDAIRAVEIYDNRQLDGHAMKCSLALPQGHRPIMTNTTRNREESRPEISPDISTIHRALFKSAANVAAVGNKSTFTQAPRRNFRGQ